MSDPLHDAGYVVLDHDRDVLAWAEAARDVGLKVLADDTSRRHGGTWFVGVDALPNKADGSIAGVPLAGSFLDHVKPQEVWHQAQLSVVFPGYPCKDADESDAAHRFRLNRDAAHVDGLLPEGAERRRHLREPHSFILGLPLDDCPASPLVVWRGSHHLIGTAFRAAFEGLSADQWGEIDVTDVYQAARREAFAHCERLELPLRRGQAVVLHRHLLHGVAPWQVETEHPHRMIAYFRPQAAFADWL